MFDDIRTRLRGIDLALNLILLDRHKNDEFQGVEYLKKDKEREGTFLLIEVGVCQLKTSRTYRQRLIRGFEEVSLSHLGVVTHFLEELKDGLENRFEIPWIWKEGSDCPRIRSFQRDVCTLDIGVVGGARYCFKDNLVTLYDSSNSFGPIRSDDLRDLYRLCDIELLRHPSKAYAGFRVDYSKLVS
ncbi:hypothetical protein HYV86_07145 [Candidatus Woesearchaeota archaeon]|nr:hypothetical protein [Candidatus Woesearchaeota archaeon]